MEEMLSEETIINESLIIKYLFDRCDIGIYFLLKDNKIVYVGQTKNGFNRIINHLHNRTIDFDSFHFINIKDTDRLNEIELKYILKFNPKYNKSISSIIPSADYISMDKLKKIIKDKVHTCYKIKIINIAEKLKLNTIKFNGSNYFLKIDIPVLIQNYLLENKAYCKISTNQENSYVE